MPVESVSLCLIKIKEFFRDGEVFITGVFIFMFDQVFHIVTVGLSTQALNMVFKDLIFVIFLGRVNVCF